MKVIHVRLSWLYIPYKFQKHFAIPACRIQINFFSLVRDIAMGMWLETVDELLGTCKGIHGLKASVYNGFVEVLIEKAHRFLSPVQISTLVSLAFLPRPTWPAPCHPRPGCTPSSYA